MDLEAVLHTNELPRRDAITLDIDHRQNGIGSASCGPGVLPKYDLLAETFHFVIRMCAYAADAISPAFLGRLD